MLLPRQVEIQIQLGSNPLRGVTEIGQAAFSGANLKSLELPKSVKTIGKMAFSGAPLENVEFSEGLESIGDNAFEDTSSPRLSCQIA